MQPLGQKAPKRRAHAELKRVLLAAGGCVCSDMITNGHCAKCNRSRKGLTARPDYRATGIGATTPFSVLSRDEFNQPPFAEAHHCQCAQARDPGIWNDAKRSFFSDFSTSVLSKVAHSAAVGSSLFSAATIEHSTGTSERCGTKSFSPTMPRPLSSHFFVHTSRRAASASYSRSSREYLMSAAVAIRSASGSAGH